MTDRSAGRYCATHGTTGDHHTDRCPLTYGLKPEDERQWDMVQAQRKAMGLEPKPFPPDRVPATHAPLGTALATIAFGVALVSGNPIWAAVCLGLALVLARVELKPKK